MGSILKFVARTDFVRRRTRQEGSVPHVCEIVIFPGVFYQRWDEGSAKPAPPKKKKGKRRARPRERGHDVQDTA